jgi:hypothetical protein
MPSNHLNLIKGREYAIKGKGFVRRSERPKLKESRPLGRDRDGGAETIEE